MHEFCHIAPHPDASVTTTSSSTAYIMHLWFQDGKNTCHQPKYPLGIVQTSGSNAVAWLLLSFTRGRSYQPVLPYKCELAFLSVTGVLVSDMPSWRTIHQPAAFSSLTLLSESLISIFAVSRIIPKNSITVAGPSIFSDLSGSPSSLQAATNTCRFSLHSLSPLFPLSGSRRCTSGAK